MTNAPPDHPYGFNRTTMRLLAIAGVVLGIIVLVWGIVDYTSGRAKAVTMIVIGAAVLLVMLLSIPLAMRRGRL
jgi:uncharacterized membrane protein